MITLTVEKRYGAATVRYRVTVRSIEQAFAYCGPDASVMPAAMLGSRVATETVRPPGERPALPDGHPEAA
jgi:hypothetical protein